MKKVLIVMCLFLLAGSVSAQRFSHGGYYAPRVIVSGGFYPYYGFGFPLYPAPYYGYGYNRPSKMAMQIQDIKNDYADKIWSAKHDKSVPRRERRKIVHQLKQERDRAIDDVKRNYYRR